MQAVQFNYAAVEPMIRRVLYEGLGEHIAVGTEEVDGRVFVKIVSPAFNGLTEQQKQDAIWNSLHKLGPDAQAIALAMAFGTDEI